MKLTQQQIAELSDDELNLRMFEVFSGYDLSDADIERRYAEGHWQYLKDWNLLMPLGDKYKITLDFWTSMVEHRKASGGWRRSRIITENKTMQRAVAELLLYLKLNEERLWPYLSPCCYR